MLEAAVPILDHGLGLSGIVATKPPTPELITSHEVHELVAARGPEDLVLRHFQAVAAAVPKDQVHEQTATGGGAVSELMNSEQRRIWSRHMGFAADALVLLALDTDGVGVLLISALSEVLELGNVERAGFEMLAAHLSSGLRLRRALEDEAATTDVPFDAELVIDPKTFDVNHAQGDGSSQDALRTLRGAAIRVDRARGSLRNTNPEESIESWHALVDGRWSLVDWFDTDERRFVLAVANPPHVRDPRGLTKREAQVAAYAALGDTHKMIAYRLGVSRPTVTNVMRAVRKKLGVRTDAELVAKLRGLPQELDPSR